MGGWKYRLMLMTNVWAKVYTASRITGVEKRRKLKPNTVGHWHLQQWVSKGGPWTSSMNITWELNRDVNSGPTQDLLSQNF